MVLHAVLHANEDFGVLGGNAQDAGDPHPEDGARTTEQQARAHAHDVAGADGGGKGGGQGAELGDVAVSVGRVVLGDRKADARADLALDEARANGHEHVREQKQHDHDGAPHETVDGVDHVKGTGGAGNASGQPRERLYEERNKKLFHKIPPNKNKPISRMRSRICEPR